MAEKLQNRLENHTQIIQQLKKLEIDELAEMYSKIKNEIDCKVSEVGALIVRCDPVKLLEYSSIEGIKTKIRRKGEIYDYDEEREFISRCTEYIQSIIVSSKNLYDAEYDIESTYNKIIKEIVKIHSMMIDFYLYWGVLQIKQENIRGEYVDIIIQLQHDRFVRGNRYSVHEIEHLKETIEPMNEILKETFNTTSQEFIQGMRNIKYMLTLAFQDVVSMDTMDIITNREDAEKSQNKFFRRILIAEDFHRIIGYIHEDFGHSPYDVQRVTGWGDKIIRNLSYEIDEYTEFFKGEFSGWPIVELPITKKPFVRIDGKSYCFDYHSIFDNMHRVMQKTAKQLNNSVCEQWNIIQANNLEDIVEKKFKKIMPYCETYRKNYFPFLNKNKSGINENDLMVMYKNNIFIIEIKSGSYSHTPAITDIKSHKSSIEKLMVGAGAQCDKVENYINRNDKAEFYTSPSNKTKKVKFVVNREKTKKIYKICIISENVSGLTSKLEKFGQFNMCNENIIISIDDLRIYEDYFDSAYDFINYMKHRVEATSVKNMYVSDEMEHLGAYIEHNDYPKYIKNKYGEKFVSLHNYSVILDYYYTLLDNPKCCKIDKPISKYEKTYSKKRKKKKRRGKK